MVPNDFDWRKYSQEHNLTNDRYWEIKDFCYRYKELKSEYERLIFDVDIYKGGLFIDARSARQGYVADDDMVQLAIKRLERENYLLERINMIENISTIPDKRLARPLLIFLTDKKYSHYTLVEFLDDQKLAVKPEYFERCWRYAICMIDANLKKLGRQPRKNHSTK